MTVGRTARTVVGVMPPRFGFPHNEQVWVPLPVQDAPPREGPTVQVFGRLADGASWQDAAAELDVVSHALPPTSRPPTRTRSERSRIDFRASVHHRRSAMSAVAGASSSASAASTSPPW